MDLVENPDAVKPAVDIMSDAWVSLHDELYARTSALNAQRRGAAVAEFMGPGPA